MKDEVRIIIAEYNDRKIEFKEVFSSVDDGFVIVNDEAYMISNQLYEHGVREFLYTKGRIEPIDFTTGKHTIVNSQDLAVALDRSWLKAVYDCQKSVKDEND